MSKTESAPAAPPAATIRLVRFKIDHTPLPAGPNISSSIECDAPPGQLVGWSLAIRGAAVFLVGPPGWTPARATSHISGLDKSGPRPIFEIPRTHCTFYWESSDPSLIEKLQRFDVPPMQRRAGPLDERPVLDSKELGDP